MHVFPSNFEQRKVESLNIVVGLVMNFIPKVWFVWSGGLRTGPGAFTSPSPPKTNGEF